MATPFTPPRRSYHLRVFALALGVIVVALVGVLFGLRMEAITHAEGTFEARNQHEARAPRAGLLELGWHEADIPLEGGSVKVRVDARGNGLARRGAKSLTPIAGWKAEDLGDLPRDGLRFHSLDEGDVLWPGQPVALVKDDALDLLLLRLRARRADEEAAGKVTQETATRLKEVERLRADLSMRTPPDAEAWLVTRTAVAAAQAVRAGDLVAVLVPCDSHTGEPRDVEAVLSIDEKHAAHLAPGQETRFFSAVFGQRLFGHADGVVSRIDPQAEASPRGGRVFRVHARIESSPFPLKLGSSVKAEIVVGRKQVYRVILEH